MSISNPNGRAVSGVPPAELLDREPPHDLEAETAVVGALIYNEALFDRAPICDTYFRNERPRTVFAVLRAMRRTGVPIDVTQLAKRLQESDLLDSVGGPKFLGELLELGGPAWGRFDTYLARLKDLSIRRQALLAATTIIRTVHGDMPTARILSEARDQFDVFADAVTDRGSAESVSDLIANLPPMRLPVLDGLLRRGETLNLVSVSKAGKSWATYGLALSIANGRRWLDRFDCTAGRVLILDNELHRETIGHRFNEVAGAMGLPTDGIDCRCLRGMGWDIHDVTRWAAAEAGAGRYDAIVIDALYRFLPDGISENDNAQMMRVYNVVDALARQTGAAIVLVHHSPKGNLSERASIDLASGAGAIGRATDSQITIRPHEVDGGCVVEATVRSFPRVDPFAIRFDWPLWLPAPDLDPRLIRGRKSPEAKQADQRAAEQADREAILEAVTGGAVTAYAVHCATGINRQRATTLLGKLTREGFLCRAETMVRGRAYDGWGLSRDGLKSHCRVSLSGPTVNSDSDSESQ